MRRACYFIAAFILASAAQAQAPVASADRLDVGVRYWLSSGYTTRSLDATNIDPTSIHPAATGSLNPSTTTNFEQLDANVIELFARKRIEELWFVKGNVGLGQINHGTLIDETFFTIGGAPFHTMLLSATDGKLGYATLDIGREVYRTRETSVGVFVGYQYWNEKIEAHGFSDAFGFIGAPPDVTYTENEIRWHMLRLGGEFRLTRGRTRLIAEASWVPYAGYRNEATYPAFGAPNAIASGNGRGGTFDAEIRRTFPQLGGLDIGIGLRYWKLRSYKGTETSGDFTFQMQDLASERHGFTFTVAKNW